jgi:PAS domain S-box-containing protein
MIVMFVLPLLHLQEYVVIENIVDSLMLAILSSPFIWMLISRSKRAEEELLVSEDTLRLICNSVYDAIFIHHSDGEIIDVNDKMLEMYGVNREQACTLSIKHDYSSQDNPLEQLHILWERARAGEDLFFEWKARRPQDGSVFDAEVFLRKIAMKRKDVILATVRDITERKRVEKERAILQDQLIQAQKMESVGRLAGGVAHDYNNMLSIIVGYSELALEKLTPIDPLYEDIHEIYDAAVRSTDITRQLLAFARKQEIAPVALDLNESIEDMLMMLRRLIGEDIDLAWLPEIGLWPVKLDPSQFDQILVNLCVNARDAINGVGRITIETDMVFFDAAYCVNHPGYVPGEYVLLAVSDDGCGMDHDTVDKIFEPFFTTKDTGKGTGLGLATVYGIIKQNNGFISVYSEPGRGTTFKVYLVSHTGLTVEVTRESPANIPVGHGEIILVVEDEASILKFAKKLLGELGYTVLTSKVPSQALLLVDEHQNRIDLLVTDVVMPEMNGKELSKRLCEACPELKTLFMSGYTADAIAHRGVLDEGISFIQKPFSKESMAIKVREVLDR